MPKGETMHPASTKSWFAHVSSRARAVATVAVACAVLVTVAGCARLAIPTAATAPVGATDAATATTPATATPPPDSAAVEPSPDPVAAALQSSAVTLIPATVVRVVDGDTAVFLLADGTQEKVRFIGIDTPESTTKIEPYGKAASAYTAEHLRVGRRVYLEKDVEARDRYGRLLAYVWLSPPSAINESELRDKLFNAQLAIDGYAQQMTIAPNVKYADYFKAFVAEARSRSRGLWSGEDAPAAGAAAGTVGAAAPAPAPATSATYIGNRNTRRFHIPTCSSVSAMNPGNKVALASRSAAISQGYVPCKRCRP